MIFGEDPISTIQQIDFEAIEWNDMADRLTTVRNVRFRHALVWQRGVVGRAAVTDAKIAVILGDMNVISNWIATLILKVRGRKVVFWGHGISGGEGRAKLFLRLIFLRLADWNLVYGKWAKRMLVKHGFPASRVTVVFNSLDYDRQKSHRTHSVDPSYYRDTGWFTDSDLPVLLFIGRLTRQKKLDQLIDAVIALNADGPRVNLVIVGSGIERDSLEEQANNCQGYTHFFGPCYDEEILAKLIANADLCVSPGEIGLTAIHCLSYGTPVCTHGNFSEQGPEVEAIVEGETGVFFDQTSRGLRLAIEDWISRNQDRVQLRKKCYRIVDELYNPQNQCRIFGQVFEALDRAF